MFLAFLGAFQFYRPTTGENSVLALKGRWLIITSLNQQFEEVARIQTVKQLRETLGLETVHQVRNRIGAVQDIIRDYIRRGDNNEMLISDEGVKILKRLQDLYESGLLLSEAAETVMAEHRPSGDFGKEKDLSGTVENRNTPSETDLKEYLRSEVRFLRDLVFQLQNRSDKEASGVDLNEVEDPWWQAWL